MVELARWLPNSTPALHRAIVVRALSDCGICENPPGSNRSGVIDEYNRRAGVPVGSYWCASAVGAWWADAAQDIGQVLLLPPGYASVDNWMQWAKKTGRWHARPVPGAAVLYGIPTDASHMGVVVRLGPILLDVSGNTTLGGGYSRNGVAVDVKPVNNDRLLGYVWPEPAPGP